jgi:hypothetical protein
MNMVVLKKRHVVVELEADTQEDITGIRCTLYMVC